ncbi:MAG: radical SAM family heme chaperone HemW [Lachnospiraceae bacterium]|nr:radical SAM family heme chaperone HemW [Lachnospiraceae bacterium]MDY3223550.1 radical SAM family heme chaperone HemW [Lachnospiraceae bacterium]
MGRLGIYIHIPFCQKKCNYCDFLSAPPRKQGEQKRYVEALGREIQREAKGYEGYRADTLFFGGGTPSLLQEDELERLMAALREGFQIEADAEITMEVNPGTVSRAKLECYRRLGINRLSIGLQSADDEELKELGRIHSWQDFLTTWQAVRECGFTNVNVDLMSALPGQTKEGYENTLMKVLALRPEHISAYSLIIEEETPFYSRFGSGGEEAGRLPDEEEERLMYERTGELLLKHGYERYEISNYSRPGFSCKHNIGYWTGKEYLGLGLGASSLIAHRRFSRERNLTAYIDKVMAEEGTVVWQESLSRQEEMAEFMFLGLRLTQGISLEEFKERFGTGSEEKYGKQIEGLIQKGLLYTPTEGRLALTKKGVDVSNQVFLEFL